MFLICRQVHVEIMELKTKVICSFFVKLVYSVLLQPLYWAYCDWAAEVGMKCCSVSYEPISEVKSSISNLFRFVCSNILLWDLVSLPGNDALCLRERFMRSSLKMEAPEKVLCQAHGQARTVTDFLHENGNIFYPCCFYVYLLILVWLLVGFFFHYRGIKRCPLRFDFQEADDSSC